MKKVIYSRPVDVSEFTAEKVLERLIADHDRLIQHWGKQKYEERKLALEEYIKAKNEQKTAD